MSYTERRYSNGEIIIKQGDMGNSFFQILEGKAVVFLNYGESDQVQLGTIAAGQYFGEMAVIEAYPRSSTVVADGDVVAEEIPESELNRYFEANPDKILEIMKHLGNRIKALTADYDEAKGLLADIKSAEVDQKENWFAEVIAKHINWFKSRKVNLSKPSAEALREAAEKIPGGESKNIEAYDKDTIIFKKGETGKCMYLVHGGSVGIYSNYGEEGELKLTELLPVACFGEMGMISEETRSATAVAESDHTYVEIIRPEDLDTLFKECPMKIEMILKHLSYRLRSLTYDYYNSCKELFEIYRK